MTNKELNNTLSILDKLQDEYNDLYSNTKCIIKRCLDSYHVAEFVNTVFNKTELSLFIHELILDQYIDYTTINGMASFLRNIDDDLVILIKKDCRGIYHAGTNYDYSICTQDISVILECAKSNQFIHNKMYKPVDKLNNDIVN